MSLIEVPFSIQCVPKSKYTTIQVEIKTQTTVIDIRKILYDHYRKQEKSNMTHPHQAVQLAHFVELMRANVLVFKQKGSKYDNPIQVEFSVNDDVFIMSVSFQPDVVSIKKMLHLVVHTIFKTKTQYYKVKQIDSEFCQKYSEQLIRQSQSSMLNNVRILVVSKFTEAQMKPVLKKEHDAIVSYKIKQVEDPIKIETKYDLTGLIKLTSMADTFADNRILNIALTLCVLNYLNVDYIISKQSKGLYIRSQSLSSEIIKATAKFIRSRMADIEEDAHYENKSKIYKKNNTQEKHEDKVESTRVKDTLGLLAMLYQFGVVTIEQKKQLYDTILKHTQQLRGFELMDREIRQTEHQLTQVNKNKNKDN